MLTEKSMTYLSASRSSVSINNIVILRWFQWIILDYWT